MSRPQAVYRIAVVDRTLDLMDALAETRDPVGVTELARRIRTTKSAVFRILSTLEQRGYVMREGAEPRYRLGPRLLYLGQRAAGGTDLRQQARPTLEALHREFDETVNLGILADGHVVYLDMVESARGLRMAARLGTRDHAHSTALGKAMLAFLPDGERDASLQEPLARRTANTITDAKRLHEELARVRDLRVAEDRGENEDGARCVAGPIFDHGGGVIAAVSVSGPASRLDDARTADVARAVRAAACEITERIGGRLPVGHD